MMPVAMPTAKLTAKIFIQNWAVLRQKSSFLTTYSVSIMAITSARPSVRGTKSQW